MHRLLASLLLVCCTAHAWAQDTQRLRSAFGGDALDAVGRFDYRLRVTDAQGRTLRDSAYVLLPASRRLHLRDYGRDRGGIWSGEDGSWRETDGQWEFLGPVAATAVRRQLAYHFLPLLRDPATRYEATAPDRLRITPSGAAPFEVVLDRDGRIVENRFDDGTRARELDYRRVGELWWPMRFEVVEAGRVTRQGRFTDAASAAQGELPPMPVDEAALQLPHASADAARLVGAGWLSSARNEYNLSLDADERLLVFARSGPEFEHAQIWLARRNGDGWTRPAPVPFSDPRYSDSDPWLTPDGRTLYFVSNRPPQGDTSRKDLDLWRVAVDADGFGKPEPLTALNSDGQVLGPELHDGWLYFNSSRGGGPAGLSIYRAHIDGARIEAPQPLGAPFNDGRAQGDFTLSPDGRTALFWSVRGDSTDADLFATRRVGDAWSPAIRLLSPINAAGMDFTPSFSADGTTLRFASMRKPAWLDDAAHVFNGQSNVYVVPAALVEQTFAAAQPH